MRPRTCICGKYNKQGTQARVGRLIENDALSGLVRCVKYRGIPKRDGE